MPESFLGNQRKAPPTQIFNLGDFRFYEILTFEYKFDSMHPAISTEPREYNRFSYLGDYSD